MFIKHNEHYLKDSFGKYCNTVEMEYFRYESDIEELDILKEFYENMV